MENGVTTDKFFSLNLNHWPTVVVQFNRLNCNEEFEYFLKRWENLGRAKQDYNIILDTRNISNIGISNAYTGANFIGRLRKQKPHYLKNVILIYNQSYMYYLFNLVLSLQKPIAKTYTYYTTETRPIDYVHLFNTRDQNPDKFQITNV
jgi:hypothetical protein